MAIENDVDRLNILTAFGSDIVVAGSTVTGIVDKEYREVGGIESEYMVADCRSIDVSGVTHGASVVHGAINFEIVGVEDDNEGITTFVLMRV